MIPKLRLARWSCVAMFPLLLTGCGQNIFSGLAGTETQSADDLIKSGNFSAAKAKATDLIAANIASKGEPLQNALSAKAVAILGENKSLPQNTLALITTLKNNPNSNIISSLSDVLGISPSDSAQAADLLNYSDAIATSTDVTVIPDELKPLLDISSASQPLSSMSSPPNNPTLSPSINSTAQFNRGFANAVVVVKMVTRYLDLTASGDSISVTRNATAVSNAITIRDIVLYLSQEPKSTVYYSENSIDAFNKAGTFTDDQRKVFDRTKIVGTNMAALRTIALNNNSGNFYPLDSDGHHTSNTPIVFNTGDSDTLQESKYTDAISQIVNSIRYGSN